MPENNKESIFVVKIMASEKPDYWNSIGGMYSYVDSKAGEKCMRVPNTWIY